MAFPLSLKRLGQTGELLIMANYSNIFPLSGGATDIKSVLQNRMIVGFSGNSTTSDGGILAPMTTTAGTSTNTKKLGTSSLSFTNQNSGLSFRINGLIVAPQWSIGCWVYFNTFNYAGPWGSWNSSSVSAGQALLFNSGGGSPSVPQFLLASGSSAYTATAPSGAWQTGQWYYCLCEWDSVRGKIRFFLNNTLYESVIPVGTLINTGTDTFGLGGYNNQGGGSTDLINGFVDEFVVLLGNTTTEERAWLWNSGSGNSLF